MSYQIIKMVGGRFPSLCQVRDEKMGNKMVKVFEKFICGLGEMDKDKLQQLGYPIVYPKQTTLTLANTRPRSWNLLRSQIFLRDKGICWICKRLIPLNEYEMGHLIDKCNEGSDDYDNLAAMHKKCNNAKPLHKTIEEHITWLLKTQHTAGKTD
jgi:hypothetical protein